MANKLVATAAMATMPINQDQIRSPMDTLLKLLLYAMSLTPSMLASAKLKEATADAEWMGRLESGSVIRTKSDMMEGGGEISLVTAVQ